MMTNPMLNMLALLKNGGNVQNLIMQTMVNNSNPMIKNLIEMAQKGDTQGVENFARNLYKEQGKDFDKEFSIFMNNFGINKHS